MADWQVELSTRNDAIVITVVGEVGVDDAGDAAGRVAAHLVERDRPMHICFDIREITSYSVKAREDWSQLLKQHRARVAALTWVTQRSTHRMVGRAVGLFTGIPTRIVDELPRDLRAPA
jgi:hypothetical protein